MLTTQELARAVKRALTGRNRLAGAIATTLIAATPTVVLGQSNIEGYVYGTGKAGTEVKIENAATGATRTATVTGSGSFRTPNVPPGNYKVTFTDASGKSVTRDVIVSIGAGSAVEPNIETVVVTGTTVRPVDMSKTESVTTLTADTIDALPVARDVQQVALLAPGVVEGDAGFTSQSGKALVSFGGASPGENAYFINGMNITDFRNFLGGSTVPYEFYDQFEVRTGGYSAEFGRSLGGVINAVTKRGTNDFEFSASAYYQPDGLTAKRPNATYTDAAGVKTIRTDNSRDNRNDWQLNLSGGGPIIEDRLFFYLMGVVRTYDKDDAVGTTSFVKTTDDSPFFGGKLDWQIADNHSLEFTYFQDETTTDVDNFNYTTAGGIGSLKSVGARDEGGQTSILRYSGTLFENLTLSALAGRNTREQTAINKDAVTGNPCTFIIDARAGVNPLSCWDSSGTGQVSSTEDQRDAYRLDLTWILGAHALKFGYDYEEDTSATDVEYEGGVGYRYVNSTPGNPGPRGGIVPAGATSLVRQRFYNVNGDFEQKLSAFYIEDSWQVTDRLMVSLGLRNETLENFNRDGEEFLDFGSQLTPRLGFSFDLVGDGRTKLFGNAGRYTMPIATNTNIRFAGGEFFTEQYYTFTSIAADGTPTLGVPVGQLATLSNGIVPVPAETVDSEIDPMYQDEYILGIQSQITDTTTVGLKLTHRNLVRAVEDSAFVDANGNFLYFLFNPGRNVNLSLADGSRVTVTADELGYPEAERKYYAAEFTVDQIIGDVLRIGGSYTWSHSYGNFEGVFQSDVQQDDAGITISFDTPGMALFSHGDLPNDRRHQFKIYGTYSPTPEWTVNFNAYALSGRPKNKRGNCPVDIDPDAYDGDCFFFQGEPQPRASAGRLPWLYNLNLGVRYTPAFYDKLSVGVDLFNAFNFDKATRTEEVAEFPDGTIDPKYGNPVYFQDPRYVRFNLRWDF